MFAAINVVSLAIWLILIIAIAAVVFWFQRESGITIPQPLRIVLLAVVAILAILLLADLAGVGPGWVRVP